MKLRGERPVVGYALARSGGKEKEKKNWLIMRTS